MGVLRWRRRRKNWIGGGLAVLGLGGAIVPLSAHHTSASFDTNNLVTLQGTVVNVNWRNPHVILRLETRDAHGDAVAWNIETLNVQGLSRHGLNQESFKPGGAFRATVCVAKDGTRWAVTHALATPAGPIDLSVGGC